MTTTADSYVDAASRKAGAAVELASSRKIAKYAELGPQHVSKPVAVESLGAFNDSARFLLENVGNIISKVSGDDRERTFLFHPFSVAVQRFNFVLLHESFSIFLV